ncbi:MAG: DUF4214 domain-containing protein [Gammaproteobacteria bacterium]|nr:DUF4214 domain-containing protein [Gammaproteobacteria bacterium]
MTRFQLLIASTIVSASISVHAQVPYATNPPTIDGNVGTTEWSGAYVIHLNNSSLSLYYDDHFLYALVDFFGHTVDDSSDYFWFSFDVDQDSFITPYVDVNYGTFGISLCIQYYISGGTWTGCSQPLSLYSEGFDPTPDYPTAHRIWEFAFERYEIEADIVDSTRFGIRVNNPGTPYIDGQLPAGFWYDFTDLVEVSFGADPTPTATLPVPTARDLPGAVTNVPYATVITAAGGTAPYIFTATGLPPGLRLTADDGLLSGLPDTAGDYTVTITVTDAQSHTGTRDYAITVAPLVLAQRTLPIGVRDAPYEQTLTALGGQPPYTFTATGLPPGLTLAVNGAISGTPTEAYNAPIQVTVQDQDEQTITSPVGLTIREVAFTRDNPVKPGQTLSAAVQYPDGRSCELDDPNIFTVPLGSPNAPATGPQGITLTDGLLQVVLQNCTTNGIPATVTLAYGDPLPAGAQYWKYGPTATDPDPHWYLLNGADLAGNTATFTLIDGHLGDADGLTDAHITDPGGRGLPNLAISGGILSRTPVNQPYRATLQARYEGPAPPATAADDPAYRWSVTEGALPPGLTLETATPDGLDALLSGVPTQVGVYFFTLQVIDPTHGQVFVQQDYRIEVIADDPAVTLITHYYRSILDRAPEDDGVAFWKDQITALQAQGQDAKPVFRNMAYFFFNSPEYLARHTTNPAFIDNLYRTFFQRDPEEDGLAFWLADLARGNPRNDVMTFFLYSQEFTDFMGYLGF